MGSMPTGDKFRVTEKYKAKAESLPKVKHTSIFDTLIASILAGVMISGFSDMQLLGYGIITVSTGLTALELKNKYNPYRVLFENLRLEKGGQIPKFKNKRKTEYGYCLTFKMPRGMSTDDFEKNKLGIEQDFNKIIEINYNNHLVFIKVFEKDLEGSQPFQLVEDNKVLEFPIGVTYGNKIVKVDLEQVVHLLIASETGGGKSTLLRGIITSLILNKRNCSLYLIDLKNGAEFNVFRKSKKVKAFCRNIGEAEDLLAKMINEVDRRYDLFFNNDVVNIQEYNKLKGERKLDFKVLIIDEFADLQNEKGSISVIEVLAAKARACGIHIILSTQRPDSQIVNGRIKANIPCVVGLKTMNGLNSRIIIDENGLERLRGKGHAMLKYSNTTELQAFNISNTQARDLIKHTYIEEKKEIKKETQEDNQIKDFSFLEGIL